LATGTWDTQHLVALGPAGILVMARISSGIRRRVAMVLGAYARLAAFSSPVHDHCHHHAHAGLMGSQNHLFMIANNPAGIIGTIISWRRRCFISSVVSRWRCLAQEIRLNIGGKWN